MMNDLEIVSVSSALVLAMRSGNKTIGTGKIIKTINNLEIAITHVIDGLGMGNMRQQMLV